MIVADTRKDQLEARLRELDERLHTIERELDAPVSPDWEERATERESEEVLEDLGMAGQQEMRMIRAALDRIRDGSYGDMRPLRRDDLRRAARRAAAHAALPGLRREGLNRPVSRRRGCRGGRIPRRAWRA